MAYKVHSILAFIFVFNIIVSLAVGRDIPKDSKNVDTKQLETFNQEGSVFVPGLGRFMIPPKKMHHKFGVNPFTYNPVTGTNTGTGIIIPALPTGPNPVTVPGYIPGADDTFIPNPGFEVPTGFPAPPIRH